MSVAADGSAAQAVYVRVILLLTTVRTSSKSRFINTRRLSRVCITRGEAEGKRMHTLRKAKLTFSMVVVEANVHTAVKEDELSFARIHDECKTRLGKPYYCPTCEKVVEAEHQVRAWPLDKDNLVPLDANDFASVRPERSETIELKKFISAVELNELMMVKPYWLGPSNNKEQAKGYGLLWHAMVERDEIALGVSTLWEKEHPVCIEAKEQGLMLWMLAQQDEVVVPDFIVPTVDPAELKEAEILLAMRQGGLSPSDFQRPARAKLEELIEKKLKGAEIVPVVPTTPVAVPNIMDAIRNSIRVSKLSPEERKAFEEMTGTKVYA